MKQHTPKQKAYIQSLYGVHRMCISTHLINTYLNYCYTHCHYDVSLKNNKGNFESHHLFPKSFIKYLQGKYLYLHNNGTNTVWLTPKEHIQAHLLLNTALKKEYKKVLHYNQTIYEKEK